MFTSADWKEVRKGELYQYKELDIFANFAKGEFSIYDKNLNEYKIPIKAIFENPELQFITRMTEAEAKLLLLRTDVNFLFANQSALIFEVASLENINKNIAVNLKGLIADNRHINRVTTGLSVGSVIIGEALKIQGSGTIIDTSWSWTPDQDIFLNKNSLSHTPFTPGQRMKFIQKIGKAIDSTKILISIENPIYITT
jgi:hypothetical protein